MNDPDIEKVLEDHDKIPDFCIKRCLRCGVVKQVLGWWCVICKDCLDGSKH